MENNRNKFNIRNRESMGRRSIRLPGYDYAQDGAYFVTICSKERQPYFEIYPQLKEIVEKQWRNMSNRFVNISLDEYVIMPNHMHGIIIVGATLACIVS
jgi:putative transposase